jgi:uncharacterized membrane protein
MLETLLRWFGFGLCHQLPERSFITAGLQAPVCSRDTGLYVGFVLALCVLALLHRSERPSKFPRLHVLLVMAALVAFMGWDGVSSYAGFRSTTNDLRLITGIGVGFSAAAVIFAMLNDMLWKRPGAGRVLDPSWRFIAWIASIPLSYLLISYGGPLLGRAFPVLIAVSIVVTLAAVNMVMVAMLPQFDRRASSPRGLVAPALLGCLVALIEIALAAQLRVGLLSLTGPLAG